MGISTRKDDLRASLAASKQSAEVQREATQAIEAWNAGIAASRQMLFVPTVGAAFTSGFHWLAVCCPGCNLLTDVDLRIKPRPPDTPITNVLPSITCSRCNGRGPLARPVRLGRTPSD